MGEKLLQEPVQFQVEKVSKALYNGGTAEHAQDHAVACAMSC